MNSIWKKIAEDWYKAGFNNGVNKVLGDDIVADNEISAGAFETYRDIDWDKDDDLDF